MKKYQNKQSAVIEGWIILLGLWIGTFALSLTQAAIRDDFKIFVYDPGQLGWQFTCILFSVYGLMPALARILDAQWFRWLNVVLLAVSALITVAHRLKHIVTGMAIDLSLSVEIVICIVSLLTLVHALHWAKAGAANNAV
jgi:hypothetical protein